MVSRRLFLLFVPSALVASTPVFARDAAEVEAVRRAAAEIEAVNRSADPSALDARAIALLERYVDFEAFEMRVFADVARDLTPAQKQKLSEALRRLLAHRTALRVLRAKPVKLRIEPSRDEGGETRVRVFCKGDEGNEIEVDLAFAKRPGPPRVADMTIAGTSISRNVRASINKVMRRDGFEGLFTRLQQARDAAPSGARTSDLTL